MSDGPLSPEEVAHRGFGTTFRGFDTGEVRAYLQRVANELRASTARERDLHRRLTDAEHRAAHPVIEGDTLTRALGEEMGRILASAQQAALGLKEKAEENSARILRDAHDQAQRIRAQAESILAVRSEEAEAEATAIRLAAEGEAAGVVDRAGQEAAAAMTEIEGKARQLVHEAQAVRARVLGDLTRRRRLLQTQVEQLRAGRERLLEAYRVVRRTTDDVADELQRVEDEAREAAGAVGERLAADPDGGDLGDAMAAHGVEPGGPGPDEVLGGGVGPETVAGVSTEAKAEVAAQVAGQAVEMAEAMAVAADAAAAEAAEGTGATGGHEASPQVVSTRPEGAGDRRPLRLLRRPRMDGHPDTAAGPLGGEGVRVIPTELTPPSDPALPSEPSAAPPSAPEAASTTTAEGATGSAAPPGSEAHAPVRAPGQDDAPSAAGATPAAPDPVQVGSAAAEEPTVIAVDELFARIRAGRADAVARAHEVLAGDPARPVPAPSGPTPEGDPVVGAAGVPPRLPADEETLLRRRDAAVEGIEPKLARKLKRALQDEQNEVLDRLRSAKAGAGPDAVLPAADAQTKRYRDASDELLRASAAAGAAFVASQDDTAPGAPGSPDGPEPPDVADVVAELAVSLAEPLRRALERSLRDGADQGGVDARIGAAYRECKAQRVEELAGDAVTAAFSRGALAAMPAGASWRWVVDDAGRPCPDCDDNALAGSTPAGGAFPTGQQHPPAHTGCRCLLAPAEMAAAVPGAG